MSETAGEGHRSFGTCRSLCITLLCWDVSVSGYIHCDVKPDNVLIEVKALMSMSSPKPGEASGTAAVKRECVVLHLHCNAQHCTSRIAGLRLDGVSAHSVCGYK